jgi:integrase
MISERTMVSWVEEYLCYRRKLGYRLKTEGAQLLKFAQYADKEGCGGHLTTDLALRWIRLPEDVSPLYLARRLEVVRCFARYLAVFDPLTEVPPKGILGSAHRRTAPHIYSEKEIETLLKACAELEPADGLRPHTYGTLFGLLSCTGLRISEALKLRDEDVDLERGLLTIRETKFHKSRLVPLHPSVTEVLKE